MRRFFKKTWSYMLSAIVGGFIVFAALELTPLLKKSLASENSNTETKDLFFDDILEKHSDIQKQFDSFFDDDFFKRSSPFDEMKKMRERMLQHMDRWDEGETLSNPFDSWFSDKFGGGTIDDIGTREDDRYIYYDIHVPNLDSTEIDTKVENGQITISGTVKRETESQDERERSEGESIRSRQVFQSSFQRSFPIPQNVDSSEMETSVEKNKIVLKFPKTLKL